MFPNCQTTTLQLEMGVERKHVGRPPRCINHTSVQPTNQSECIQINSLPPATGTPFFTAVKTKDIRTLQTAVIDFQGPDSE